MSKFDHIKTVEGTSNRSAFFYYVYPHGTEKSLELTGFTDTRELFDFIKEFRVFPAARIKLDCVTLGGVWEVDDNGNTYDFDGEELCPGDTWLGFKRDHWENMREVEADNRARRAAIAREEGMLNGIDSYNDWMGY